MQINNKYKLQDQELNTGGCFKLAKAVIWHSFTSPYYGPSFEHEKRKLIRINFAKNSELICHWANIAEYNEEKIRKKILRFNSLPKEQLLEEFSKFV